MRKTFPLLLAFGLGFFSHPLLPAASATHPPPRTTGIGGIFFQSKDPGALKQWYARHLGLEMNEYGTTFYWQTPDSRPGLTQWTVMPADSKYFAPSASTFMINYRVENLAALVPALRQEGVKVLDEIDVQSYGSFVHILDCDGNKVELWEPSDS